MNWKCFFGHDFKVIDKCTIRTFDSDNNTGLPIEHETNFLLKCSKCCKLKMETFFAYFPDQDDDDDDDDDKDPPPSPTLSPDDFYASLEKE